jgi:hypothetical protein
MNYQRLNHLGLSVLCVLLCAAVCAAVFAQSSGGGYTIRKAAVASGGGASTDGTFKITGTAGQGATVTSTNGTSTVASGFWFGALCSLTGVGGAITPGTLPNGVVNQSYNQLLNGNGGIGPYLFQLTSGALPSGLNLDVSGAVAGTPTAVGTANFSVTVTDGSGCMATQDFSLTVNCPTITLAALPNATAGVAYNVALTATPVGGNYSFVLTGLLPPGLSFNNGSFSGVPTVAGNYSFTVTATGFGSCTGGRVYNLTVTCPTISLGPSTLPNGVQGTSYNQTVSAGPPGTTYSYAVTTGALPTGLSLNTATGAIKGTPTSGGAYTFGITATGWTSGAVSCTKTQSYNILITGTCATITIDPATLPNASMGVAYNQSVSANPAGTYTFAVSQGTLPLGLTLNTSNGAITGTPTFGGTYSFRITATGAGGCTGSRGYIVSVTCGMLTFNPATLPIGTKNLPYSQTISVASAGTYTFSLQVGSLPPGFTLSSAGVLSGITSQAGTYNFTVRALGGSCQGIKAYTLVISANTSALAQLADYDGDGKSDFTLWSNNGGWRFLLSNGGAQRLAQTQSWGKADDLALLGDYDADRATDLAVFRPAEGTWYIKRSSDGGVTVKAWGVATDVPVPGDYDGDGKSDLAVFRPSDGRWYVLRSADQQAEVTAWGAGYAPYNDVAVPGDYDGDGQTDFAVFRRATGTWLIKRSSDGQFTAKAWGTEKDVPVAADYDGDGRTDFAIWRQGVWYIWQSASESARIVEWGTNAAPYFDRPVPGDYDGDGQADIAVWRAGDQTWYVRCSLDGSVLTQMQGQAGDRPVAVLPQP